MMIFVFVLVFAVVFVLVIFFVFAFVFVIFFVFHLSNMRRMVKKLETLHAHAHSPLPTKFAGICICLFCLFVFVFVFVFLTMMKRHWRHCTRTLVLLFPLISVPTAPINKLPIKTISPTADIDYQKYKYMTN